MNKGKQLLFLLCLLSGLSQTPAANAQVAEALVGIGFKLIPVAIPLVLTAIPMGVQAVPMIPGMIRNLVPPLPLFGKGKKNSASAESSKNGNNQNDGVTVSSKVTGEVVEGEPAQKSKPAQEDVGEPVTAYHHVKPADNSEWFLDDDNDQSRNQPAVASQKANHDKQKIANKAEELHVVESVKAVRLTAPASTAKPTTVSADPDQSQQSSAEESAPLTIMMKVSK